MTDTMSMKCLKEATLNPSFAGDNYDSEIRRRLGSTNPKELLFFSWSPSAHTVCDPNKLGASVYSLPRAGDRSMLFNNSDITYIQVITG